MTRRTPAQYNWDKLEFDETLLKKHFTSMKTFEKRYVVVHHMTIIGDGKGKGLDGCWNTWQNREASAHYGVDGSLVRQYVYDKDYAWATGNTLGNLYGISIEHANSKAAPGWEVADDTWRTGARLAAQIHVKYKFGRPVAGETLFQHSDFFATECAGPYLGRKIWAKYVAEAQRVYDEITAPGPKPEPTPDPDPEPIPAPAPVPGPLGWWQQLIQAILDVLGKIPPPSPPPPTSTFWGGYGNLHAPYTFTDDWLDRAPQLAAKVKQMGVSWFIALEGHGDTRTVGGDNKVELAKAPDGSMQPIYKPFLDALGPTWRVAEGEGGNHLFYDSAKYQILKYRDALMPGRRWMTGWKVRRIDSGAEFWINAAHLSAGSTSDRVADREAQGRFLAETINPTNPVILGIDRNNSTRYDGSPWQVLEDAGLLGLRVKSPTVTNGETPTHHGSKPGAWIDDMHTSPPVTVDSAEVVATGDLSDHNFLKARFTVPA